MPHKFNIVEAVKYKQKNPDYRVWFAYEVEDNYRDLYYNYEEELIESREEYGFVLAEGFEYPSYYDHEDFGWSKIYTRHILGEILAETFDEYTKRKHLEFEKENLAIEKDKKALDRRIKKQEKELKELKKKRG